MSKAAWTTFICACIATTSTITYVHCKQRTDREVHACTTAISHAGDA